MSTATTSPTWSEVTTVITAQVLTRGSTLRGTLDLRTYHGARLFCKIGRGGTNALTNGLTLIVRPVLNNDSALAGGVHPYHIELQGSFAAAAGTTVNSNSNSGQAAVNVASSTGFAAGDFICIQDSGGGVTRLEWHRVSKVAAGVITCDRNLQFSHTGAGTDTVRNKADVFAPIWLTGGSLYEVVFDYGDDSAGDSATVSALAQLYTADTMTY